MLLDEHFALSDVHTLNLPGFETTARNFGYPKNTQAIVAEHVIPAAKDAVQFEEAVKIETVINAGIMELKEDNMSFVPAEVMLKKDFLQAVARGYFGADLDVDHLALAQEAGLFTEEDLVEEPMTVNQAKEILSALKEKTEIVAIYMTCNIHGDWIPYPSRDKLFNLGAAARAQSILKESREELGEDRVLYIEGGDALYNTTLANVTKGDVSVATLNKMGLAVSGLGNHDFDYPLDNLLRLIEEADYEVLSCNTRDREDSIPEGQEDNVIDGIKDSVIVELGGRKIGILGATFDGSAATTLLENTKEIKYDADVESASKVVEALEKEGVDHIIALAHLEYKNQEFIEKNPSVEISLGGGNDIAGKPTIIGENQYWINPGTNSEAITQVNIVYFDGKESGKIHNQHFLSEAYEEDAEVKALIDEYNSEVDKQLDETIGYLAEDLEWSPELVRTQNPPIANLVTDALRAYFAEEGAELCLVNAGGIRAAMDAGEISIREVTAVLPFDNDMTLVEASGQTIWDALQNGISSWPQTAGKFPQVSGMRYEFDGEKLELLSVTLENGEALDLNGRYKIVINSFIAGGGDNYDMFNIL